MFGHAADAGGAEFEILRVNGVGAAELFVAWFLPFGSQGGVDDFLRMTIEGEEGEREEGGRKNEIPLL